MEYAAGIYHLSRKFFEDYPHSRYPEIATKNMRPYSCLLVEYLPDLFLCVPFRSHIRHPYAYHFKSSARSRQSCSGLDYSKSVLLKDMRYLDDTTPALVDQDEYRETIVNLPRIIREASRYVLDYKDHITHIHLLHPREFERRYGKSTLPYFDELLLK